MSIRSVVLTSGSSPLTNVFPIQKISVPQRLTRSSSVVVGGEDSVCGMVRLPRAKHIIGQWMFIKGSNASWFIFNAFHYLPVNKQGPAYWSSSFFIRKHSFCSLVHIIQYVLCSSVCNVLCCLKLHRVLVKKQISEYTSFTSYVKMICSFFNLCPVYNSLHWWLQCRCNIGWMVGNTTLFCEV